MAAVDGERGGVRQDLASHPIWSLGRERRRDVTAHRVTDNGCPGQARAIHEGKQDGRSVVQAKSGAASVGTTPSKADQVDGVDLEMAGQGRRVPGPPRRPGPGEAVDQEQRRALSTHLVRQ